MATKTIALDVWLDADDDPEGLAVLVDRLEAALPAQASVTRVHPTTGALWPVPVAAAGNRVRARIVVPGDGVDAHATSDVLDAVATVAPWSLASRVETTEIAGTVDPPLH